MSRHYSASASASASTTGNVFDLFKRPDYLRDETYADVVATQAPQGEDPLQVEMARVQREIARLTAERDNPVPTTYSGNPVFEFDPASIGVLECIAEDYIMVKGKKLYAYEIETGTLLDKESFIKGVDSDGRYKWLTQMVKDKVGNNVEIRIGAGDFFWKWPIEHSKIAHVGRRVVSEIVMEPTKLTEAQYNDQFPRKFNTYFKLKEEMIKPDMTATAADVEPFIALLSTHCEGCAKTLDYQINWLAYLYQNPGAHLQTSLVYISDEEGTGKSMMSYAYKHLFGASLVSAVDGGALYGSFDCPFVQKRFVFLNEVERLAPRQGVDPKAKLKHLTGSSHAMLRRKGIAAGVEMPVPQLVITTNIRGFIPNLAGDRRFCICLNTEKPVKEFVTYVRSWIGCDGVPNRPNMEKLAGFLATRDLSNWNPGQHAPNDTLAKNVEQSEGKDERTEWLESAMHDVDGKPKPPFDRDLMLPRVLLKKLETVYSNDNEFRGLDLIPKRLAKALRELGHNRVDKWHTNPNYQHICWRNRELWAKYTAKDWNDHEVTGLRPWETEGVSK